MEKQASARLGTEIVWGSGAFTERVLEFKPRWSCFPLRPVRTGLVHWEESTANLSPVILNEMPAQTEVG